MIAAQEVADTLRLLIPGFVALKVFYLLGLRTKRSDLEWTLWSVLTAAIIGPLVTPIGTMILGTAPGDDDPARLGIALLIGALGGLAGAVAWWLLVRLSPQIRMRASRLAWDAVLPSRPSWVQIWTSDGKTISGRVALVADPVESDALDLYVTDPAWIDSDNHVLPMTGVEGVLIDRSQITFMQVQPG